MEKELQNQIISSIKDLKEDNHVSFGRLETKLDTLNKKLEETNERSIVNSTNIENIEKDVLEKGKEFHRQINIVHKVVRNCKTDHEKCPVEMKEATMLSIKNWFYGTWVVGGAALLLTIVIKFVTG